ncbi:Polymerase (RNA) III (DNA directed) polypeptide G [Chamberlinius hualienensis]
MAGRGRGRGSTFKPEFLGLTKSDLAGKADQNKSYEPQPLYTPLYGKPLSFEINDEKMYRVNVMRKVEQMWRNSPYYLEIEEEKKGVERYSDRYKEKEKAERRAALDKEWVLDPTELPSELLRSPPKKRSSKSIPKPPKKKAESFEKTLETLEKLESAEKEETGENSEKEDDDEDKQMDEEAYEDGELDEGADYGLSYFDNGEDYLENDDDNVDEGPIY